jgi:Holliday junction resolvase RusA-like endonuclease
MIHDLPKDLIESSKTLLKQGKDYDEFFQSALKKFGVNSPADFKSDEEKKKFFDYVDKNFKGKNEEELKKKVNEELLDENIQKVVKLYPRDNDWKKLVSKYKRDIENFMKGRKDLPAKVEDELLTWGFDNGEIKNEDDAENFIDNILNA